MRAAGMFRNFSRRLKRIAFSLLILQCFWLLNGCAQQHAFISSNGIESAKLDALSQQLEAQGWKVTLTQLEIPREFPDTSIAINPAQQNQYAIEQLIALMQELRFGEPHIFKFAEGKHFYSINNIGLYIRGSQPVSMPPSWLRSDNCEEGDALLSLKSAGSVTLEYDPFDADLEQLNSYQGRWQFDGETLNVHIMEHQQDYIRKEIMRKTWRGYSPAQLFTPLKEVEFAPLNCHFIIIEAE